MSTQQELPDDLNPQYLFSGVANVLLIQIVKGEIDPVLIAKQELANRGWGLNNEWIGFDEANKLYGLDKNGHPLKPEKKAKYYVTRPDGRRLSVSIPD